MNETRFSPIKKGKRVFEEVAAAIKISILNGHWKGGDRLPAESELANQFGVSRNTIREALRTLEMSGLVSIQTGVAGGPIVKDTIMSHIGNLYLDAFQMEKISLDEVTVARQAIEKVILDEAIHNLDEKDIEKLRKNVKKARSLVEKGKLATDVNFEFHSLLAEASKNKVFIILEKTINKIHHNLRSNAKPDLNTSKIAVEAHEKLLVALEKRKTGKVEQIMKEHVELVKRSLTQNRT